MNTLQPSAEYLAAIEEGKRHHASSKTYSGSLLRPHKPFLTEMVGRLSVESILDVGAGKGKQYRWVDPVDGKTLEQAWGVPVRKYDPCWPPYSEEPEGQFDLVLCTHTVSLIPEADLSWFMARLFRFATKGVFIAEKIGERKKAEVSDPGARSIGKSAAHWVGFMGNFAIIFRELEIVLSLREVTKRGRIVTRHIWRGGIYVGAFEAGQED